MHRRLPRATSTRWKQENNLKTKNEKWSVGRKRRKLEIIVFCLIGKPNYNLLHVFSLSLKKLIAFNSVNKVWSKKTTHCSGEHTLVIQLIGIQHLLHFFLGEFHCHEDNPD